MESEATLDNISKKLTLVAAVYIHDHSEEGNGRWIELMDNIGLSSKDIGQILNMKASAVAMARSRLKAKNGK